MKKRSPRNRTLTCSEAEIHELARGLLQVSSPVTKVDISNQIIHQEMHTAVPCLPKACVDLLIIDPPYNLTKDYHGHLFKARDADAYTKWFRDVIELLQPLLTAKATVYVCSDWRTSTLIYPILEQHFHVRNRITWEREKGRGAQSNWKNNTEDIWFCTQSEHYEFNVDAVKLKRRVIAPYRTADGRPKDWSDDAQGQYRLTHPSNLWSDITVPFWSMPENTDHPTQKPEKLIAKLILASSKPGDFVLDPFLGSGTTAVVAQKLGRTFCGIERNRDYACWALKRLKGAETSPEIQGYADGVFWERNTLNAQRSVQKKKTKGSSD